MYAWVLRLLCAWVYGGGDSALLALPPPLSFVNGCLLPSPLQAPAHKHFPGSSECVGVGVGVLSQVQRVLAWLCCHLPCSFEHVPHKEPLSQLHETQLRSYPQCKLTGVLSGS